MSPPSRLTEVFVISVIDPPWEDQCEWHGMTSMTGPDCVVMCNLINAHTHTRRHIFSLLDVCGSCVDETEPAVHFDILDCEILAIPHPPTPPHPASNFVVWLCLRLWLWLSGPCSPMSTAGGSIRPDPSRDQGRLRRRGYLVLQRQAHPAGRLRV